MATAWPGTVPQRFALDGQFSGPENSFLVTNFDKGRPQRRRNTLGAPSSVSMELVAITRTELAAFETWYADTLSGGALTFEMTHPIRGDLREWAFAAPYRITAVSADRFNVALSLTAYPYAD